MPKNGLELYPLRFEEISIDKVWGGEGLKKLLKKKCSAKAGECVELVAGESLSSRVVNGDLKGKLLRDLLLNHPREILGNEVYVKSPGEFPLAVKFLYAKEPLSLQVHPSDDFAARYELTGTGKMEAWYVVIAPKEARAIRGVLPGITIAEFRQALDGGNVKECLNVMDLKEGDVIFIPPGTLHSAYGGAVLLEIQQNSDITYRLTDWGRKDLNGKPRMLHLQKALSATDFYTMGVTKCKAERVLGHSYKRKLLLKCEKFTMESMEIERKRVTEKLSGARSFIYTIVAGKGEFRFGEKFKEVEDYDFAQTFLIPAAMGDFEIVPKASTTIVCSYV